MAKKEILVVEDEEDIQELIRYNLAREGFQVRQVFSGEDAFKEATTNPPHLILLDLMLPGIDGLELCRLIKTEGVCTQVPVLMLTARGEDADIVTGLEMGADDYLTKPFSPKVLIARIRNLLRRNKNQQQESEETLSIHTLIINPGRREVLNEGQPVELTFTEFQILHLLASRPGWVFSRNQIVEGIRGDDYPVTDRAVDVQIVALRKKLASSGKFIETVRGVGYRFRD